MDQARKQTDKKLAQMERKVNKIYTQAYDDVSNKWIKFMDSHASKLEKTYNNLQDALKSGDREAIAEAKETYQRTAMNITVNNKRYQGMVDETAAKISHTNQVALDYVNGNMANIYTINYNQFGSEKIKGYSFSLVNENAVKELATTNKLLLPKKKVDIPKDMRWNIKNINSQVIQGILQGESIPKLAQRLMNVTDMNRVSAIRNARTMTTSAENKGRQDSFKKATEDGVVMEREWVAAHDDRTRAWHLELHGVRVGVDEPWENEYGEIMYPGDPTADPANVYNCRCSIRAVIKGFKWNQEKADEAPEVKEESEPITNKFGQEITFDFETDKHDAQVEVIKQLSNEYDTRLVTISGGAEKAAGDVDIMGQYMRLSDAKEATAIHEFGHTLANTSADKYGLTNDKEFWSEIRKVRTEYRKAVREDSNYKISSYADSEGILDEFMCEAFTQAKCIEMGIDLPRQYGDDLTYSNQVLAIIDEYFKRKHK